MHPLTELLDNLFTLNSTRIFAFFLALLPAFFNLFVLIFVFKKLPRNLLTNLFALWVIGLMCWQLSDLLLKLINDKDSAQFIGNLLWLPAVSVAPIGLHFALLFTNQKKILKFPFVYVLIYLPLIFFEVGARAGLVSHPLVENEFWGWILAPTTNFWGRAELIWIAGITFLTFLLLLINSVKMRNNKLRQIQSLLLTVGYLIPVIQGTITQIIFPYVLEIPELPLTSFFMTFFSVAAYLALTRFELLNFTPEYAAEQIIDIMSDGLCVIDQDQKILLTNRQFRIITGYDKEITSNDLKVLLHLNKKYNFQRPKELPAQYEISLKKLKVLVSETAITNKGGRRIGSLLILTDISKRVNAEIKLKERNDELSTFIYRTSHDLRGPLSSIMGIVGLFKDSESNEDSKLYLNLIDKSTNHLDEILKELLLVAAILRQDFKVDNIDLKKELHLILNRLTYLKEYNNTELRINNSIRNQFHTDRRFLTIILENILKNAFIYINNSKPIVYINMVDYKDGIKVTIKDNGIGINPKVQDKIYQMFYRGTTFSKGSGLGLFIVKKAVDLLSGTIKVESKENIGTTVTVYLPDLNSNILERLNSELDIKTFNN